MPSIQHEHGYMLQNYFVKKLKESSRKRDEVIASISTRKQALDYQAEIRKSIQRAFRPWPKKCPLNSRILDVDQFKGYRVEKILFESTPGILVPASVYVPDHVSGKVPGVVGVSGHSGNGRADPTYQEFAMRLVLNGTIVIAFEPVGQGERSQYCRGGIEKQIIEAGYHPDGTDCHNLLGKQLELVGHYFGAWETWDGIRAVDYLLSRKDVDPQRIAVTGQSGGGTQSVHLFAVDERVRMAAPSCYVTTFLHNLENEMPQDSEQYPPGILGDGLELADLMIVRAPAPVILLGMQHDYFDHRGLRKTYRELRHFHTILGGGTGTTSLTICQGFHMYAAPQQVEMVKFFHRHWKKGPPTFEQRYTALKDEDVYCSRKGKVHLEGSRDLHELISNLAPAKEQKMAKGSFKAASRTLKKILQIKGSLSTVPHYRVLRHQPQGGQRMFRIGLETEEEILAILKSPYQDVLHAFDVSTEINLYLPNASSQWDLENLPSLEKKLGERETWLLDTRGVGESLSVGSEPDGLVPTYSGEYMHHGFGLLFGESLLGAQVRDFLLAVNSLRTQGAERIHLTARGRGSLIALFGAVLKPEFATITLWNAPEDFRSWVENGFFLWPPSSVPKGILQHCDLPDLRKLFGRKLKMLDPWDHLCSCRERET